MPVISVFENMEPTYTELTKALAKFSFERKHSGDAFVLYSKVHDLKFILPLKKMNERLDAGRFGAVSSQLAHFGITEHMDDLGKMIKAMRETAGQTTPVN